MVRKGAESQKIRSLNLPFTMPRDWRKAIMVPIYKGGGGWEPFGSKKLQAG